jgi:hypothetical protein
VQIASCFGEDCFLAPIGRFPKVHAGEDGRPRPRLVPDGEYFLVRRPKPAVAAAATAEKDVSRETKAAKEESPQEQLPFRIIG